MVASLMPSKISTGIAVLLLVGPATLLTTCAAAGIQMSGAWDVPGFIMAWTFFLGAPTAAVVAAVISRKRPYLLVINAAVFLLWIVGVLALTTVHG